MSRRILLEDRNGRFRRRRVGIGVNRCAGAYQVLVIQERAAECALKKMIGEHEFLRQTIECRLAVIVMSHREAAGVGPGGVAVVLAAVDLHLMFEESMVQVAGDGRCRERDVGQRGEGMLDRERCIRQTGALRLGYHGHDAGCGDTAPSARQLGKQRSVAIDLRHIRRQWPAVRVHDLAEAFRAREIAVQIVEGAILGVDHDDGLDLRLQRLSRRVRNAGRRQIAICAGAKSGGESDRSGQGPE